MKAAFIDKPMSVIYTDVPEPQITKDDEVKIRVKVTGICNSEIQAYHGVHPYRIPPVVSGHEFAGIVTEVGEAVTTCKVGDRVTAEPHYGCGECEYCKTGKYNICRKKVVLGSNSWSGCFGEYVVVPETTIIPLPDNVTFEQAALIEPLAVGLHLVRKSGLVKGQSVAIIGAGTIGLGILLSAKLAGAKNIIVSDMIEYNLQLAKQLGATRCIDSAKENPYEKFKEYSGDGRIDVTYIAVSANDAFQTAIDITSPDATIAAVAIPKNAKECNLDGIVNKELRVIGSNMYLHDEFEMVRDRISEGKINVEPFISKIISIKDAAQAMGTVDKKIDNVIKVMLRIE